MLILLLKKQTILTFLGRIFFFFLKILPLNVAVKIHPYFSQNIKMGRHLSPEKRGRGRGREEEGGGGDECATLLNVETI